MFGSNVEKLISIESTIQCRNKNELFFIQYEFFIL